MSYETMRHGRILSYTGEAIITMGNGKRWRAIGRRSTGDAAYGYDGFIELFPLDETD